MAALIRVVHLLTIVLRLVRVIRVRHVGIVWLHSWFLFLLAVLGQLLRGRNRPRLVLVDRLL